jgi:hypothetical protein
MSTAITPEVVGLETQIFEDTPMTPAEQRKLVELETCIKTKLGNKMEADLAIGGALLQIQRERLYRSPEGGRRFDDYIEQESHRLTPDGQTIGQKSATYLRGFYYFREEVLPASGSSCSGGHGLPLPSSAAQVRPLLFLLDHLRRGANEINPRHATYDDRRAAETKAIEIWKAAVTEAKGKTPTFDQVNRARLADNAAAEQHRLRGRADTTPPPRPPASRPEALVNPVPAAIPQPVCDYSPPPTAPFPTISAWELEQTEDTSLDAGVECKRITLAINDAHKAIGLLRGILYSQINKHGRDYLGVLRQVDAGVYSLHNIDDQIQQMGEDIAFVFELLTTDVGEGELARATVDAVAFPTRA